MPEQPGLEESAIRKILAGIDPIIDGTAAQQGKPSASKRYSAEEQVNLATFSPYRDPETAIAVLVEQGLAAGKKPQDLADEVMDAVYPQFRKLIETGRPRLEERIEYGDWLGKEIPKRGGWPGQQMPDETVEGEVEGEVLP